MEMETGIPFSEGNRDREGAEESEVGWNLF